jgi:drug/metabolite transporter (DMT)-like permease
MWLLGWPLGLFLSAVSSVFGILGKLFLKLAHNQRERDEEEEERAGKSRHAVVDGYVPRRTGSSAWGFYFYSGLFSMLVMNPALGAVAYCFATQSLLAPMAGLTIGWNTLMGPMLLPHERLTTNDFVGAFLIFTGCVLVGVSGTHETPLLPIDKLASRFVTFPFLLYCVALFVVLVVLIHHAKYALHFTCTKRSDIDVTGTPGRNRRVELSQSSRVSISVFAGVMSGQLFFLAATMRLLHDDSGTGIWRHPLTYVCIVGAIGTALFGLYLLNEALKVEDAVVVIYLYEASYILAGAISGLCFFQDMKHLSSWHYVVYSLSLLLILLGIYVVAKRSNPQAEHEENLLPLLSAPPIEVASAERIFQKAEFYAARRSSSPTRLLRALRSAEEHSLRRKSSPFILTTSA